MDTVLTKPIHSEALDGALTAFLSDNPPIRRKSVEIPNMDSASRKPVDLKRLTEITMGDTELESELIVTFLADTAERLAELASVLAAGDASQIGRTAHALKGSAGNMGAETLQALARDLEEVGKTGDVAAVQPTFERLRDEANRVREYLTEYMHV